MPDALVENILQEVKQRAVLHQPFKRIPLCLSFPMGNRKSGVFLAVILWGPQLTEHFSEV